MEPRIYTYYKSVLCQDMIYLGHFKNIMQFPQITQCVLNSSSADALKETATTLPAQTALQAVTGQKGKSTRSRKSIAFFQLRKGNLLGCAINLRGAALYSFLDQYLLFLSPRMPAQRITPCITGAHVRVDCNFGGMNLNIFPGLETHFLKLSRGGGFHCTFCALGKSGTGGGEVAWLLSALQFPLEE